MAHNERDNCQLSNQLTIQYVFKLLRNFFNDRHDNFRNILKKTCSGENFLENFTNLENTEKIHESSFLNQITAFIKKNFVFLNSDNVIIIIIIFVLTLTFFKILKNK